MLAIVNEELMSYRVTDFTDKKTGRVYNKLKVNTSNKIVQEENPTRYEKPNYLNKVSSLNRAENQNVELVPLNREVITISAPLALINEEMDSKNTDTPMIWDDLPMTLNIRPTTRRYENSVEVRCHEKGMDRANIYVVAFPFNGLLETIPEDPRYRIYKGFIASSRKHFFFNNKKYRKVLYLIIEVNKNLFNEDHKYHCDSIPVVLESYALYEDRIEGRKKTNHEKMVLNIDSAHGDHTIRWEYELIDDAIYKNVEPGTPLWTTFQFSEEDQAKFNKRNKIPNKKNGKKKFNRQNNNFQKREPHPMDTMCAPTGNYKVVTNKHGIRKEVPVNNNRRSNNNNSNHNQNNRNQKNYNSSNRNTYSNQKQRNYNQAPNSNIDDMMKNSGMYDKYPTKKNSMHRRIDKRR